MDPPQQPLTAAPSATAAAPTMFAVDPSISKFSVNQETYIKEHPTVHGVLVGAFVFDPSGRLLLVQRAASDSMPLLWEVPGGACDPEDETLIHGAARELWEEAGLRAVAAKGLVGQGYGFVTRRQLTIRKYSFLFEVEGYDVKLDENEHQAFVWATEEEAKAKKHGDIKLTYTSAAQTTDILEAFKMIKDSQKMAPS